MGVRSIVGRKQSKVEKLKQQIADLQQENRMYKTYAAQGKAVPQYESGVPATHSKKLSNELRRAMVRKGNAYCTMYDSVQNHKKEPCTQRWVYINPSTTKELGISTGSYGITYDGNSIMLDPNPGINDATVSVHVNSGARITMPAKIKGDASTGYYAVKAKGNSIVIDLKTSINPLTGNLIAR